MNSRNKYEIQGFYNLYINNVAMQDSGEYICQISGHRNYTASLTYVGEYIILRRVSLALYALFPLMYASTFEVKHSVSIDHHIRVLAFTLKEIIFSRAIEHSSFQETKGSKFSVMRT